VEVFNLVDGALEDELPGPEGYRWRGVAVGELLGARLTGVSVYELPPGRRTWPYHWETAREEWLVVLSGEPTVREPDGERRLAPGDVVCFPVGPDGAHQVRNETDATARVAIFSSRAEHGYGAVYPDSDKTLVVAPGFRRLVRLSPELDYWDGEA
jgi:uncharacterized cupin superfamily protein